MKRSANTIGLAVALGCSLGAATMPAHGSDAAAPAAARPVAEKHAVVASTAPAKPLSVDSAASRGGEKHETAGKEHGAAHWSYAGAGGPEEWGRLQADFLTCYTGRQQSPIDIADTQHKSLPALAFAYQPTKLNVVNNGHTVQFNFDAGSQLESDGRKYDLLQVHFHAPSEHALRGKRFPAEFHLVHKHADGKLAVVGFMVIVGNANAGFRRFLESAPAVHGEERKNAELALNASDLLPRNRAFVRYDGSLTTPPCSEGVAWHVLTQPVEVSAAQLEQLKRLYSGNARPVQRRNDRELVDAGGL